MGDMGDDGHVHSADGPDDCFGCKIQYMKLNGFQVRTPTMRQGVRWWDTTYKEQQELLKREHGQDARPKNPRAELI